MKIQVLPLLFALQTLLRCSFGSCRTVFTIPTHLPHWLAPPGSLAVMIPLCRAITLETASRPWLRTSDLLTTLHHSDLGRVAKGLRFAKAQIHLGSTLACKTNLYPVSSGP